MATKEWHLRRVLPFSWYQDWRRVGIERFGRLSITQVFGTFEHWSVTVRTNLRAQTYVKLWRWRRPRQYSSSTRLVRFDHFVLSVLCTVEQTSLLETERAVVLQEGHFRITMPYISKYDWTNAFDWSSDIEEEDWRPPVAQSVYRACSSFRSD